MADAAMHVMPARRRANNAVRNTLRSLGMTTGSDSVRWSVVGPIIIGGVMALMVTVGTVLYAAGGVSRSVESLSSDMSGIKEQMRVQASALTHLDDEFRYGGQRMDNQDKRLSEIEGTIRGMQQQLADLKEQVAERQVPIRGPR